MESSHKTRKNRIRTQQYYQCILNPTFNFRHIARTPPTSPAKISPKIKAMVEIPSVALRSSVGESKLDTSNQGARKTTITQMLTKIKTKHFLRWSSLTSPKCDNSSRQTSFLFRGRRCEDCNFISFGTVQHIYPLV